MAGFDSPFETWNARFAREDYLFGEEPNAFVRTQAHWLPRGGSVLCVADGEGRNSVWLAEQGPHVTAFDFAPNAVAKARHLAERRKVSVSHELGDTYTWRWTSKRYDAPRTHVHTRVAGKHVLRLGDSGSGRLRR